MGQERGQASAEHHFGDPCNDQGYAEAFGRMTLALEHRPMLVVDRNFSVLWRCDRTDRLLDRPLPLCVRDGKLVLEDELGEFPLPVGHFHARPVGPHPRGSVQVTVPPERFAEVASWFALNRAGLTLFVR